MYKLKDLTGIYNCVARIDGELVLENRQAIIDNITRQVEEQGGKTEVKGNAIYFGSQFYNLPLLSKERFGTIEFRSKDYIFRWDNQESFGDKPKSVDMTETGFKKMMFNGETINYILGSKLV